MIGKRGQYFISAKLFLSPGTEAIEGGIRNAEGGNIR
jgi:hypothetical protein